MKENDCISRKRAIERLKLNFPISQGADDSRDRHRYMQAMADIQAIREMPSVEPQEPRWIPVSERLPKIADVYLVTRYYPNNVMNPKYIVDACCFDGSNTWYNDNRINHERAYANNVIAWQENPEPYEPQESEGKE